jgi:hypothetical protein
LHLLLETALTKDELRASSHEREREEMFNGIINYDRLAFLSHMRSIWWQVRIQCEPGGRLVIAGMPEDPDNPWGVTPFRKVSALI